jgi:hypothetical protein
MTEELQWVLTKYPRGYHWVSNAEMYLILDAFEYQMESPGGISGAFGISRETLRVWGIKKSFIIFGLLFSTKAVSVQVGAIDTGDLTSNHQIGVLIGLVFGFSETALPSALSSHAASFLKHEG